METVISEPVVILLDMGRCCLLTVIVIVIVIVIGPVRQAEL
jgi:hypothetical protein